MPKVTEIHHAPTGIVLNVQLLPSVEVATAVFPTPSATATKVPFPYAIETQFPTGMLLDVQLIPSPRTFPGFRFDATLVPQWGVESYAIVFSTIVS
ncbi:hypothetical protein [Leptospira jelokensis]|uniref:hypothetical protein n=1 Tax=Leptospira jelokensis TaxID=2484931 RepID=UPI001438699B|nr:hypothetical protein [Leptospira jelokensis]